MIRPASADYRWIICALLFFATTINYLDRQVLGILATPLQKELDWSESQYGWIAAAFTGAYAAGQLIVGRLMDRLGTRTGVQPRRGLLEPGGDGPCAGAVGDRLRRGAVRAGIERIGQFPRGDQDGGRVVPEDGARPRHGDL